jgi:replicative DNA helicase
MSDEHKALPWRHISQSSNAALRYIDGRRKGEIKSLTTPWKKFNAISMGGIEWQTITTIAGMSGSGKTAVLGQLETGLKDLNPDEDFAILSFNFEMLSSRLVARKLSNKMKITTQQLYSASENFSLNDNYYMNAVQESRKLNKYDIYYVDIPGSVKSLEKTVLKFSKEIGKPVIVMLDHTLLVKKAGGAQDRDLLYDLMAMFNGLKKLIKVAFILISQMNRNIEASERIQNPDLHYPKKQDIFGADACYMYSDIVVVTHRPEMLGIRAYGPKRWPTDDAIFWHYLKVREGEPCIALMQNNLAHNEILDAVSMYSSNQQTQETED